VTDQLVFYAGRLIEPVKDHQLDIPDGSYIRYPSGNWAHKDVVKRWISIENVPKDIRLMAFLITGES
jgi:hypothetical protein